MSEIITEFNYKTNKKREYEFRKNNKIFLNINTETNQMKKLREVLEKNIPTEDLYLIEYIINKIWFEVSYSESIESKISNYLHLKY